MENLGTIEGSAGAHTNVNMAPRDISNNMHSNDTIPRSHASMTIAQENNTRDGYTGPADGVVNINNMDKV